RALGLRLGRGRGLRLGRGRGLRLGRGRGLRLGRRGAGRRPGRWRAGRRLAGLRLETRLRRGLALARRRQPRQRRLEAEALAQLRSDVLVPRQRILRRGGGERAREAPQAVARDLDAEGGAGRIERRERVARGDEGEVAVAAVAALELGEDRRELDP